MNTQQVLKTHPDVRGSESKLAGRVRRNAQSTRQCTITAGSAPTRAAVASERAKKRRRTLAAGNRTDGVARM
jgi:hypothetical protein